MQGNLSQVPLPEVLQFISMGKSTGLLSLKRSTEDISLTIVKGRITNSSSLERKRRIGDLLVNRGLLKRSELARLLKLQQTVESGKKLGQLLTEREIVSEETIRETIRLQLEEEIWSLFAWEDGQFVFETVDESKIGASIVRVDIEPLILEGTRRNDEWKKILTIIPHDNLILKINDLPENFERDITLRDSEWRVLSHINGEFTVRAIVNRSNMGRFEVFVILSQFIRSGLINIDEEKTKILFQQKMSGESVTAENSVQSPIERAARKKGLFSSILGDTKKSSKGGKSSDERFISPIGALAALSNALYDRLSSSKDYKPESKEGYFLDLAWMDIVQVYTRADLIISNQNHVEVRHMEYYLEKCEFSEVVDECYEDANEALLNMIRACTSHFSEKLGNKIVDKAVSELLEEFGETLEVKYRGPYAIKTNVQQVLGAKV